MGLVIRKIIIIILVAIILGLVVYFTYDMFVEGKDDNISDRGVFVRISSCKILNG